ncbi:MAG TPA: hypothetical protein VGD59_15810 [Acidisarcina sp.]
MRRVSHLLPLCVLLLVNGCKTSEDATAAATQMTTTASALVDYYAALEKLMKKTDELNRLQEAMLTIPYQQPDRKQIADQAAEFEKREQMAEELTQLAGAFTSLASPAAAQAATDSTTKLQTELASIKQLTPATDEINAMTGAMQLLVSAIQQHKEREAAKAMAATLTGLDGFFLKEMRANESLDSQFVTLAGSLATNLVDQGQIDESSYVQDALGSFDLTARVTDPGIKARIDVLAKAHIAARGDAEKRRFARASTGMEQALAEMARRVNTVASDKAMKSRLAPPSLADVAKWTAEIPGK